MENNKFSINKTNKELPEKIEKIKKDFVKQCNKFYKNEMNNLQEEIFKQFNKKYGNNLKIFCKKMLVK